MRTPKNPTVLISALALVLGVILGLAALFESGWRIGRAGLTHVARGKVCVTAPLAASVLYVDDKQAETSRASGRELCANLAEGEHTLLLTAPGVWPWWKKIMIESNEPHAYHAFTLPQTIPQVALEPGTEQYSIAQNMLVTSLVPSADSPLRSADASLAVWFDAEARQLRVEWRGEEASLPRRFCEESECESVITLLANLTEPLRAIALVPGRDDVVLIATGSGIYALEITSAKTPNFQPIYAGTTPTFVLHGAISIYVGDGSSLFKITLDAGL